MATQTQIRALQIIDAGGVERPAQFARAMWPDAEAWQKPGKCGAYGVSKGAGMRMAGGGYLGKLRKAGLISSRYVGPGKRELCLTDEGRKAMSSNTYYTD